MLRRRICLLEFISSFLQLVVGWLWWLSTVILCHRWCWNLFRVLSWITATTESLCRGSSTAAIRSCSPDYPAASVDYQSPPLNIPLIIVKYSGQLYP